MDSKYLKILKGSIIGVGLFFLYRSTQKKTSSVNNNNNTDTDKPDITTFNPTNPFNPKEGPGVWFYYNNPKDPKTNFNL